MFKKIIFSTFFLFLVSCSNEEVLINETIDKNNFNIETSSFSSFTGGYDIVKTGKIQPIQDITLSSKANGRVGEIFTDFGNDVYIGDKLIALYDTVSNYGLNLEKSNLGVESSKLNYDSTKISLDKQVGDFKINLDKLEKDHEILEKTLVENIKSAKLNLDNSINNVDVGITNKAQLDYDNLIKTNLEQIKSFETTSENDYLNLKNIFIDVIDFSDKLLGVTPLNRTLNDSFEDYLGAKNRGLKNQLELDLIELISFNDNLFNSLSSQNFEIDKLNNVFIVLDEGYGKIIPFLNDLESLLKYSLDNVNLTSANISGYEFTINGYQSSISGNHTSFLNFKSNVEKFLNTYKDNEESFKKQLEISSDNAQITYNKIILDSEKSLSNSLISIKNANLNFENAIKNRDVTLLQLNNNIKVSLNSNSLALNEFSKLSIYSPINGVISDILVDIGQDISIGTPVLKLSSLGDNEIEIGLSFSEINFIKIGTNVEINYLNNNLNGVITSISKTADENLNYKAKILVESNINISGNIVDVNIPVKLDKKLIPLKLLKVKSDKVGEINAFMDNKIEKVLVNFGSFFGENVEIIGCIELEEVICDNLEFITNDISNYDEDKFNIIKK